MVVNVDRTTLALGEMFAFRIVENSETISRNERHAQRGIMASHMKVMRVQLFVEQPTLLRHAGLKKRNTYQHCMRPFAVNQRPILFIEASYMGAQESPQQERALLPRLSGGAIRRAKHPKRMQHVV